MTRAYLRLSERLHTAINALRLSVTLRLLSILQRVGAPKTTTELPSASVAQLPRASAENSRIIASSVEERTFTNFAAAFDDTSALRPAAHDDSEQRQNVANRITSTTMSTFRESAFPLLSPRRPAELIPNDAANLELNPEGTAERDSSKWCETSRIISSITSESNESALAIESQHPNSKSALHTEESDSARTISSRILGTDLSRRSGG
mmetsp:Transcript_24866/g.36481  ORF Transcript_24866/g.36481 Transcript_24866/m.36481 type:complete len:208 (+) Transcript_24866:256-879(+)